MPRLKLTLAYDGTDFCGWQIQQGRPDRTVQGELEKALARICNQQVRVHGSGRTDSGVHALGQVAHADIPEQRRGVDWRRSLNSLLPDDVSVLEHELVPDDFHSRYCAKSKVYTYTLWPNSRFNIPQRRKFLWSTGPLDFDAMDAAAELLEGEHDFSAFQNVGTPVKDTVRTVTRVERSRGAYPGEVVWTFQANGFLKQMVRNMTGLLVEIGRGRFAPEIVPEIIAGGDRCVAYPTAPPQGLTMAQVIY